jgi:putative Mg2+ transporter-C (MgtC) family protein
MTPAVLNELDLLLRVALAAGFGAIVGWERELQRQAAGFRTHALVAMGSGLFTVISAHAFGGESDPGRIAAQVVTGLGFIGAGTILRGDAGVRGLTTAASIWAVGAIGMAAGAGMFALAAGGTILALFVLEVLDRAEAFLKRRIVGSGPPTDEPPA